jgi:hypothetical protein
MTPVRGAHGHMLCVRAAGRFDAMARGVLERRRQGKR